MKSLTDNTQLPDWQMVSRLKNYKPQILIRDDRPKHRLWRRIALVLYAAAFLIALWFAGRTLLDHLALKYLDYDRSVYRSYKSVRIGMSRDDVIERMGRPLEERSDFQLFKYRGYEGQYERARASGATSYLLWIKYADAYCIGFDDSDKVVVKGTGGF